jgi:SAM-dependent methyltransferase
VSGWRVNVGDVYRRITQHIRLEGSALDGEPADGADRTEELAHALYPLASADLVGGVHPGSIDPSNSALGRLSPKSPCASQVGVANYLSFDSDDGGMTMSEQKAGPSNAAQIEFWNSAASRAWADEHERMDRAVAKVTEALLDMAAPQPGERVLDIGCGSGTTTLELAARVAPAGHVLGADIAEQSVARARGRIADAGLRHAEVVVADVSSQPFGPNSFDLAFSRFGVMFFSDPVSAFANVRRAMKPGGRVAVAVFRAAADDLWPNSPLAAVRHLLPPISVPGPEEPGPFSWADPGRVHRILEGAGFRAVSLTPLDPLIQLGEEAAEAAQFMMLFGPLTRVVPALPAPQRDAVRSALEIFFQGHTASQGIVLPAANWVVRARV